MLLRKCTTGCVVWALLAVVGLGQETADKEKKPTPETIEVKAGAFRVSLELEATLEAVKKEEIALHPETLTSFEVLKAVPHGATVKQGEQLIWFDDQAAKEQLQKLRYALETAEIALRQTEVELKQVQELTDLDMAAAKRSQAEAKQDLEYFLKVDRPLSQRGATFSMKMSQANLENAQEEFKQLEKMYKADDLTEESEEMVLKRARDAVESAKFSLESNQIRNERTLSVELPRKEVQLTETARRNDLAWDKSRITLPLQLHKKQLDFGKAQLDAAQAKEQLAKLEHDLKQMQVTAPMSGVVYYGASVNGTWPAAAQLKALAKQLSANGTVTAHQVLMTIVQPSPLRLRADVSEKQLEHVQPNLTGEFRPTAFSRWKLPAKVTEVSSIPVGAGNFEAMLSVQLAAEHQALVAGMSGKVKLTAYNQDQAISVPSSALFDDENGEKVAYVLQDDGSNEKRAVEVGYTSGDKVEILAGLKAGEKILTKKPTN